MVRDHQQHRDAGDAAVELRRMDRLLKSARAEERAAERARVIAVLCAPLGPKDVVPTDGSAW